MHVRLITHITRPPFCGAPFERQGLREAAYLPSFQGAARKSICRREEDEIARGLPIKTT
jgi:hypothetical protein